MSGFTESRHEEGATHDVSGAVGDEELTLAWVDAKVSESHDGNDGKEKEDVPRWTERHFQAIGVASATSTATDASPSPTEGAIKRLQLQVDRDSAAQVFRATPVALRHPSSSGGHTSSSSDPPSGMLRGVDSLLEEFSSVIKLLSSGAPVDADDDTMAGLAAVAADPSQQETPMLERNLSISPFAVGLYSSSLSCKSSVPSLPATASLKPPPPSAQGDAGASTTKSHRRKTHRATKSSSKPCATRDTKPAAAATKPKARKKPSTPPLASSDASSGSGQPPLKKSRVGSKKATQGVKGGNLTVDAVGIESSQMGVVNRVVDYMCHTTQDAKLVGRIMSVVDYCKDEHLKKERAFSHLPGAILEHLLEIVEPDAFLHAFHLFRPSRPPPFQPSQPPSIVHMQETSQAQEGRKREPPTSELPASHRRLARQPEASFMIVEYDYVPNVIEAAVGFGFHLARLHPWSMDVDLQTFLTQGAATVTQMTSFERMWLWKYLLNGGNSHPTNETHHPQEAQLQSAPPQHVTHDANGTVENQETEYFKSVGDENAYAV